MSGQLLIAAQGWIFSLPPCCMGGRKWKLCHHQNCHHRSSSGDFCAPGRATERRGGKEHLCPAENGKCGSGRVSPAAALSVGISFFVLLPLAFTTSLRLIHSPDAETVWANYAEHYVLKWAIHIGKCRLKILWFQHSSKYKPVIYWVYGVPFMKRNSCT